MPVFYTDRNPISTGFEPGWSRWQVDISILRTLFISSDWRIGKTSAQGGFTVVLPDFATAPQTDA
jgi:hypothetical protein